MPDPQQQSAPDVVIVDDSGTEHHFPAGFDVRHAIAIVKNHGSSALPTKPVSAEDFTGTNMPLITGTTNAQELRTIGQEIGPENAQRVREMQAYGEDAGIGLGAAALTGGTSALGNLAVKAAVPGLLYRGGKALGVPPWMLDTAVAISGAGAVPSLARVVRGAMAPPEAPSMVGAKVAPPKMGAARGPEFFSGEEAPMTPTARAPIPRIVGGRTSADWTPPSAPTVPQQTSSIQPTENAFVNVDKPQPLPSDNPSGYHTETTGKGTGERMQAAHKIIKAEDANYQGAVADLKATVGPDFLKALLDSLNRGGR